MFFLITAISGVILLIIVLLTDTESDDAILMPILCSMINFGLIGTIIFLLSDNLVITITLAIIIGVLSGLIIYLVRIKLETEGTDYKIFEGEPATVEIPFSKNTIGRVTLVLKSGEREAIPARAFDLNDPPYEKGDKVIIKNYNGSIAEIIKSVNWEINKLKKGEN